MSENEILREEFCKLLNSWGIKDIKDIPVYCKPKEESKTYWLIK